MSAYSTSGRPTPLPSGLVRRVNPVGASNGTASVGPGGRRGPDGRPVLGGPDPRIRGEATDLRMSLSPVEANDE